MIAAITKAYRRTYTDTGQAATWVEWIDTRGRRGSTVQFDDIGAHVAALLKRAAREGVPVTSERF